MVCEEELLEGEVKSQPCYEVKDEAGHRGWGSWSPEAQSILQEWQPGYLASVRKRKRIERSGRVGR